MAAVTTGERVLVEECRGVLFVYSDGSVVRNPNPPFAVPVHDDGTVEWKDVVFDPAHDLKLRLYRPRSRLPSDPAAYPVFYYFHGGGFCIGSRAWPHCQNYCLRLAADLRAVVVAPDYRLAPEHRLPAAIHDGAAALRWLFSSPDLWLAESADLANVFVSGDSAGGTIAHHLSVSPSANNPVRGYVLLMPFFGGARRTRSEAECPPDAMLNLDLNDRFWRLSLPEGADADHPASNPFGPASESLEGAAIAPMLVVVGERDLLTDRAVDYAERLKGWGKPVEVVNFAGQQHGFFTINPRSEPSNELMRLIKGFINTNGGREERSV